MTNEGLRHLLSDHGWALRVEKDDQGWRAWYPDWPTLDGRGPTKERAIHELHDRLVYALVVAGVQSITKHVLT